MRERLVRDGDHHPALDGVRGMAILLVLGQHAPTVPLVEGFVCVTVFFCLSGYLITTLLERSYSIYLWNVLARIAILSTLGHTVVGDIVWIAMFVVLAEASFRFVERPMRAKLAGRSRVSDGPPIPVQLV